MPNIEIHGSTTVGARETKDKIHKVFAEKGKFWQECYVITTYNTSVEDHAGSNQPFLRLYVEEADETDEIVSTLQLIGLPIEVSELLYFVCSDE